MTLYENLIGFLNGREMKNVPSVRATYVEKYDDYIAVIYHSTKVVKAYEDGRIELNSGGWHTATTKARLNDNLPRHWNVYQKDFEWYLRHWGDESVDYSFYDGITLKYDAFTDEYSISE